MNEAMVNCQIFNFSNCPDTESYNNALRGTIFSFLWMGVIFLIPVLLVVFYILKSSAADQVSKDRYSTFIKYTLFVPLVLLVINIIVNLIFSIL